MNELTTTATLGLAGLVTTGLFAWQAPLASADQGSDDRGGQHAKAFKREDDSQSVVTTVDDDDDDDTGMGQKGTQTRTRTGGGTNTKTNTNGGTNTGTRTRGGITDHSRARSVRDFTNDGKGRHHVDHSRHHTNDRSRHNTRG
jgi:hypothetical protein